VYSKVIIYLALMFAVVSCSVKVKELDTVDKDAHSRIVISVLTDIPQSNYEVKQIKKEIEETYRKNPEYRNLKVCLSYTPEAYSCKKMLVDHHAHVTVTIKELAGIGDAGNVYSDRIEGKGYAKVAVAIKDKEGKLYKEYILESSASHDDTELAKGVGDAVRKIAKKAVSVSLGDIYSLSNIKQSEI